MIKKGEIYLADLSTNVGSEQSGKRPVLIIQNDTGNLFSPTTIVASITKHNKKLNMPTHVMLGEDCGLKHQSIVMLEQIRTVDKARLCEYIGKCDKNTLSLIDEAIRISFSLK